MGIDIEIIFYDNFHGLNILNNTYFFNRIFKNRMFIFQTSDFGATQPGFRAECKTSQTAFTNNSA